MAINVGANTNEPGFRGPIRPDGEFCFLPIPEREPTREPVPTYGELASALTCDIPAEVDTTRVHLDPTFAEYPLCSDYTYGDPHGVKSRPLSTLRMGDRVYFYATLTVTEPAEWLSPRWGAFLIGHFTLARDPLVGEALEPTMVRKRFPHNAHAKRATMDAAIILRGEPANSGLYRQAVPLSASTAGIDAGEIVTEFSTDSGKGPWWRRPLRFEPDAADHLSDRVGPVR